jgi:hypothetical protein
MRDSLRPLVSFLAALAGAGLILSILSHLAAFLGRQGPLGDHVFWLHIGIFVVWIPTVLVSQRLTSGFNRKDFWKAALRGCPAWMKYAVYGFFAYAFVSFFVFVSASPAKGSGSGAMSPAVVRGFSGHWMAFYSAAMAVLYSAAHLPASETQGRRCPNGHSVGPYAQFCERCGRPVTGQFSDFGS